MESPVDKKDMNKKYIIIGLFLICAGFAVTTFIFLISIFVGISDWVDVKGRIIEVKSNNTYIVKVESKISEFPLPRETGELYIPFSNNKIGDEIKFYCERKTYEFSYYPKYLIQLLWTILFFVITLIFGFIATTLAKKWYLVKEI